MVVATRPLRGSRLSSFYPSVPDDTGLSLSDFDSAFQLQEYISVLIRQNPHDVDTIVTPPGRVKKTDQDDRDKLDADGKNDGVDESCWIYEQLRRLAQDLTHPLITSLQQECTRASCPEMKAGEWLYLCVAHGNDGAMEQCCAIDYIIHTLDSATALLNSPRAFPSRISIPQPSVRHFSSLARRLGRIFSHAYFHHREVFESSEAENALYARFLALTARFDLVPPDFLVIPPRVTNPDSSAGSSDVADPPRLLGAALNPEPHSGGVKEMERSSVSIMESPRKGGRNRTDTMVFSDAEAFSEALRGQGGSPTSFAQERDVSSTSHRGGLDLDSGGPPHVDSLEVLAESSEVCHPHSFSSDRRAEEETEEGKERAKDADEESKPYTLTFSASGTMKTVLPPGVSPSQSAANGVGLASSPLQVQSDNGAINSVFRQNINSQGGNGSNSTAAEDSGTSQFVHLVREAGSGPGPEYGDPISIEEERSPSLELEEPVLERLLSLSSEENLMEYLRREDTQLVGQMTDVELREAKPDEGETASTENARAPAGGAEREGEGEFVVIGNADKDEPIVDSTGALARAGVESEPSSEVTEQGDLDAPGLSGSEVTAKRPSDVAEATGTDDHTDPKSQDLDTSLETDIADVEKVLSE